MYKATVRDAHDEEVISRLMDFPPTSQEQKLLLRGCPSDFYIDVCRLGFDGLSDTANFRHIVEADLEPFT